MAYPEIPQVKPSSAMQYLANANAAEPGAGQPANKASTTPDYLKHQDNPSMAGGVNNMVRALLNGYRQNGLPGQGGAPQGGMSGQAPLDLASPNPMAGLLDPNGIPLSNPMATSQAPPAASPFDESGIVGAFGGSPAIY